MAGAPCIISVAITGSVPRKRDNPANAALVAVVAAMADRVGRPVATAAEARRILGLPAVAQGSNGA
ncbi:3-keto-5-aminohexanoate cleavage protein [Plastoroseomonas hellenica]|uniref:3-keto-5-aminohexanoate cleavage protein n=1 Tax=Plastoroseomonas hellenica TaxID=2687306 RepID=UPI001BA7303D|nr:3-keto-5-aminohexanoate cleavage protein [Plastoroseomonas hellenica]